MMKDGNVFRVIQENCWNPEVRIKQMDKSGTIQKIDAYNYPDIDYIYIPSFFHIGTQGNINGVSRWPLSPRVGLVPNHHIFSQVAP